MIPSKSGGHIARAIAAIASAWLMCAASPALAQQNEQVLVKRPAQLRDAPGDASKTIAALPVQTAVTRLGDRQGPWIKVRTADGTNGWVHMFDIAAPASAQTGSAGAGALRSITGFFNKGSAQANASLPTSTVGIRGLGAEDIANAQPNLLAVVQADAARADAGQAQRFASSASLVSRPVPALPAPAPPPNVNSGPGTPNRNNDTYSR